MDKEPKAMNKDAYAKIVFAIIFIMGVALYVSIFRYEYQDNWIQGLIEQDTASQRDTTTYWPLSGNFTLGEIQSDTSQYCYFSDLYLRDLNREMSFYKAQRSGRSLYILDSIIYENDYIIVAIIYKK